MKNRYLSVIMLFAFCCSAALLVCAQSPKDFLANNPAEKKVVTHQDPGEVAFQANCSRCHSAPEQLSPRITGTVVRHMRVRANLSDKEAQLILHYLAP